MGGRPTPIRPSKDGYRHLEVLHDRLRCQFGRRWPKARIVEYALCLFRSYVLDEPDLMLPEGLAERVMEVQKKRFGAAMRTDYDAHVKALAEKFQADVQKEAIPHLARMLRANVKTLTADGLCGVLNGLREAGICDLQAEVVDEGVRVTHRPTGTVGIAAMTDGATVDVIEA